MVTIEITLPELLDFMCWRLSSAKSLDELALLAVAVALDLSSKADYTLIPGAIELLREAYKKRLDELKKLVDTPKEIG